MFESASAPADAFGEEDGSIFISRPLVSQLDDADLLVALAHMMGHVRSGDYGTLWRRSGAVGKTAIVAGQALALAFTTSMDLGALQAGQLGLPGAPSSDVIREGTQAEIDANWIAAGYLARIGISPVAYYSQLMKLSVDRYPENTKPSAIEDLGKVITRTEHCEDTKDFRECHFGHLGVAQFGKVLDALAPPAPPSAEAPGLPSSH